MDRDKLPRKATGRQKEGMSVRAIAAHRGVHRGRAERAVRSETSTRSEEGFGKDNQVGLSQSGSVFVGRLQELAQLGGALRNSLAGQGRMVLLGGEPGIGKTRTAQELAQIAAKELSMVLWGRCYEGVGAPPYWPWVQIIRSYAETQHARRLRSQMGPGAPDIAELVPEIRSRLSGLERPPALEPEQARFRLMDSVTTFLKRASLIQPITLILDNLHGADRPTLLLLEYLAQEMRNSRLLVLGTFRDVEVTPEHPLTHTLGELTRQPHFQRLSLTGLSLDEVGEFLTSAGHQVPPQGLIESVHARTQGNPLFVTELQRALAQAGPLEEWVNHKEDPQLHTPPAIHDVIRTRLNRLSPYCNRALATASVIGREFDLSVLERVQEGLDQNALLELLSEAEQERVIEELDPAAGRYQFSHVLIQETLVSQQTRTTLARVHGTVGEALEEVYGQEVGLHAADLAYHFGEAAGILGPDKLVRYSLLAGQNALGVYAYEDARRHFERGLAAKRDQPMDDENAALLVGLGRAQSADIAIHQSQEAIDNLIRALDYHAARGRTSQALEVAAQPVATRPGLTRQNELIARGLELVPPDSHEAGRLLPMYGMALHLERGDAKGAAVAFQRALAIAKREGDELLEMRALSLDSHFDSVCARFPEALEKSRRALDLSSRIDDPYLTSYAYLAATNSNFVMGKIDGLRSLAENFLTWISPFRERYMLGAALCFSLIPEMLTGNWTDFRKFNHRALESNPGSTLSLCNRAVVAYQTGDDKEGDYFLGMVFETLEFASGGIIDRVYTSAALPIIAQITRSPERIDVARQTAEYTYSLIANMPLGFLPLYVHMGLALSAIQSCDTAAINEQYDWIQAHRGTANVVVSMSIDHLLGLLAHNAGMQSTVVEHFEQALAFCRRSEMGPELAWTCHDYADALLQDNGYRSGPEKNKATDLLEEGLGTAHRLKIRPLIERILALQSQIDATVTGAAVNEHGLTRREIEVLCSVAMGRSNQEIAGELGISRNTVSRHLSHIFARTGTKNRAEVAAFAARHGILSSKD